MAPETFFVCPVFESEIVLLSERDLKNRAQVTHTRLFYQLLNELPFKLHTRAMQDYESYLVIQEIRAGLFIIIAETDILGIGSMVQ